MALSTTARTETRASWRTLAGCGVLAMFGVSALYGATFGLFMLPLQDSLGWSRGEIAFSLTLITLVGPAVVPITGWVIDNVRLRPLVLWGVVLQSANLAGFGFMGRNIWVYYGLVFALMFTAAGPSILTLAKVVQGWFDQSLGRAMGILFACGAVGGIIHPLWVQAVITQWGWREAFMAMGGLCLVIGGGAAWWFVHQVPPEDAQRSTAASELQQLAVPTPMSMAAFMRDLIWWKLALWNMLFAFGAGAIFLHYAALLQDRGASPANAAIAMSLLSAGGLLGNLAAGWLIDRWSAPRLAVLLMLGPMLAALVLYAGGPASLAIAAGLVLGLCSGSDSSLSMFLARRYFHPGIFGRASATQLIAATLGGGVSPWLSGLIHDRTGSYDAALLMAAAAFGAAAVAAWWLPESREAAQTPLPPVPQSVQP
ncbi:MAG: MFS transporter [Betaproteobacteria bacterium]